MVTASWIVPTAVDNSGSFNTESNFVPGDVFNLGATAVVYTFTDLSGNAAVCSFNIIVNSKVYPQNLPQKEQSWYAQ